MIGMPNFILKFERKRLPTYSGGILLSKPLRSLSKGIGIPDGWEDRLGAPSPQAVVLPH